MTENNPPMVMAVTDARAPIIVESARAGAFWDLTDIVADAENYPYLAAGSPAVYQNIAIDGRVYGIFRGRAFPRGGIYYRLDIAKEAGFDREVKTIDDLTELAEKLAKYSDDTYALNMCSYTAGTINVITVLMGAPNGWGIDENGDIYPAHLSPAYLEGLNWLRHLYEIGGIDPDFSQIPTTEWDNIERNNKAFMRFDCLDNAHRQQEWFEANAGVTEQIFQTCGPIAKADGSAPNTTLRTVSWFMPTIHAQESLFAELGRFRVGNPDTDHLTRCRIRFLLVPGLLYPLLFLPLAFFFQARREKEWDGR